MHTPFFALLDTATCNQAQLFEGLKSATPVDPRDMWADPNADLSNADALDAALQDNWRQGLHTLLALPYDAGNLLVNHQAHPKAAYTMQKFWVFGFETYRNLQADEAQKYFEQRDVLSEHGAEFGSKFEVEQDEPAGICNAHFSTSRENYLKQIKEVQSAIGRGEVYQINHTMRLNFQSYGAPVKLYYRLRERQKTPFGMLAHLPFGDEKLWLLGFSPELFLEISPRGDIITRPMKGTAPILHDGFDQQRAEQLKNDSKNRAENVMIVDLLRNDLGRIAKTGSVKVPERFCVTPFGRVWQMTSTVSATVRADLTFSALVRATFPCGSISGAPKKMSMQHIQTLESSARGLYTGSLGYVKPATNEIGFEGVLNVAIRTLTLTKKGDVYQGIMGVGSGIVADSDAENEYEECGWKAQFLTGLAPTFSLIETLRIEKRHAPLLPHHIKRMMHSAAHFHFPCDINKIRDFLTHAVQSAPSLEALKLRVELRPTGELSAAYEPLSPSPNITLLVNSAHRSQVGHLATHKTSARKAHNQALQQAGAAGAFDAVLFSENGEVAEGARSNIFVQLDQQWYAAKPSNGLFLNGIMRQKILTTPSILGADTISERVLFADDLKKAERVIVCNALRGILSVDQLIEI